MANKGFKKYGILGILFFLPVLFLLFLYPSKHNYNALDIVNENVEEVSVEGGNQLKGNITILTFFGKDLDKSSVAALNLKELVYDKFKGFKKFQILSISPQLDKQKLDDFKREIAQYDELKYWKFNFYPDEEVKTIFNTLKASVKLDANLATDHIFIIDKDLNQRGRIDDREDSEKEKNRPVYGLASYNCVEVAEIKNKMSDDLRILFTEYRQKRKGNFDSSTRRASDLKNSNEQ